MKLGTTVVKLQQENARGDWPSGLNEFGGVGYADVCVEPWGKRLFDHGPS
jgi:hypothetical protein